MVKRKAAYETYQPEDAYIQIKISNILNHVEF